MLGLRDRPKWRTVAGGSHRYVEALTAPWRDAAAPRHAGASRSRATPTTSRSRRAAATPERFDDVVVATHSDQALRLLADPDATASTSCSARSPTSPTRRCSTPTRRLLPRRRRAWASWNYHLLDEPHRQADRDLPHEPPAVAARRAASSASRSTTATRSTPTRSSARSPTRTRSSPPQGQAAQARHHEISGQNRTHYCGAYWGWGFHEDGVKSGERVATQLRSAAAVSHSAVYEGQIRHRRFAVRASRVPLPDRDGLPRPRRAPDAARRPARRARAPGSCASAAATTSAIRRPRSPTRSARWSRAAPDAAPDGPDPAAHPPAHASATASTRSASTTASPPDGERARGGRRRGHQHPVGRAPRLRARAAASGRRGRFDKALHVSPFMPMDQRYTLARAGARRDAVGAHREPRGRAARVRRHARPEAPPARPRRSPLPRATRPPTLRMLALIYGHAVALKLKGVPVQPHPAR